MTDNLRFGDVTEDDEPLEAGESEPGATILDDKDLSLGSGDVTEPTADESLQAETWKKRWDLRRPCDGSTGRVSMACVYNTAQGWIPASQPFQSGHMYPPAWSGCGCFIRFKQPKIVVRQKRWITRRDHLVCEVCYRNEYAGWIDEKAKYPSGHMKPKAHDRCRCREEYRDVYSEREQRNDIQPAPTNARAHLTL